MADPIVVGIDLGGSHVSAAVVNHQGALTARADHAIDRNAPADTILRRNVTDAVREAVRNARIGVDAIAGIGMGLPGNIDRAAGICRFSPNFHWTGVPVAAPLREAFPCPIFLLNDVRCHTLGELHFGAGRGIKSFALLAVGTGIGGGIVINGRLVEGAHGAGGEVGHITVDPEGPLCGCGNRGCVEALAAAPAIGHAGQIAVTRDASPALLALAGSVENITAATVAQAAAQGDPASIGIWQAAGRWLGIAVADIITTVDPDTVLIGGKVARAGDLLFAPLRDAVAKRCRMMAPGAVPILPTALGDDAGLIGAGALALESLGYLPSALNPA